MIPTLVLIGAIVLGVIALWAAIFASWWKA